MVIRFPWLTRAGRYHWSVPEVIEQRAAEPIAGDPDDLLQRIISFVLDDPDSPLPFTRRLARDHRWSVAYAVRVVREYRRFLYLAMKAGHMVVPSEAVDQAWHLHLLYTRSYWDDLCRDILGAPIHHGPTRGGPDELEKHTGGYQATLDSYERLFGEAPPIEIWPSVDERFAGAQTGVHVYTHDYWLVPRPRVWMRALWRWCRGDRGATQ